VDAADDRWLNRKELAARYKVPPKTPAEWASKGTGPRYAVIGKHALYRLSDVVAWENTQFRDRPPSDQVDDADMEQGAAV
jgi:hypothetical protein